MIHYEAVCLGEVVGTGTYLMLDLSNFQLIALSVLLKHIASGTHTGDLDVSTTTSKDSSYRVDFLNMIYNAQTNRVEYKDGLDASKHYKIKYEQGGRFVFDRAELMILGKIADRFVIFNPGYSDKLKHIELSNENIEKMSFGFKNISAQAGVIVTLDEAFAIGLNKVMRMKYLNARVSMPSDRKPYIRSNANGFPQFLKDISDNGQKTGNIKDIAIYMLVVALSANESSKIIDKNFPEQKEQLKYEIGELGKYLVTQKVESQAINEIYKEIIRLFNSQDENDNIFVLESVKNIFKQSKKRIEKQENMQREAERRKIELSKPVLNIEQLSKNYLTGITDEFATSGFRHRGLNILCNEVNKVKYEVTAIKNKHEFKIEVEFTNTGNNDSPFHVRLNSTYGGENIAGYEYILRLDETVKAESEFRGFVNMVDVSTAMHNKIYWNR